MSVGPWQIAIIALVVLLLFGATRLGDIGKGLGEGIKNFKKGLADLDDDEKPGPDQGGASKSTPKQLTDAEKSQSADADPVEKKEA